MSLAGQAAPLPGEVSIPSILTRSGKTALPKQSLSCRWVINDANMFLWGEKYREFGLSSSSFSSSLPMSGVKSSWFLLLLTERDRQYAKTYICLYQGGVNPGLSRDESRILISGCTFSFLCPETCEEKYSVTARNEEHTLGESQRKCVKQVIDYDKVKEYIFDGILTIQVTASLLCVSCPEEAVDHTCAVPTDKIRDDMHSLYKNKVLTDATIKCGGKEFKVHRAVLGSQSPVFKAMLQADMKEKQSSVIDISDITPAVMSDLVTYLYTGAAPNVGKLAEHLLNAANKYRLSRLFTMCENELRMKIKVESVVDTLLLADLHNATSLKKACLEFIRKHSADVHKTSRWKYLKNNLGQYRTLVLEALK